MIGENKQQKIAIYARVSSREQAVEGVSIEAQTAALRAYAKSQAWEIVEEYVDRGFSGGTDDRPALKRLLTDAGRHRFSIVAVCKLDRFFRNLRLLLNHLHGLEELGIKFVSTQEGLDTSTPYGKFAVQIMGVIAEFERGRIGERVRDSRRYLVSKGNWPGGRSTYGYHWLSKERKWEIVPAEAATVRHVYDLYVKNRISINSIVTVLKKDGVRTHDGVEWRYSKVREMLAHTGNHRREHVAEVTEEARGCPRRPGRPEDGSCKVCVSAVIVGMS
jgi:site-specific DNA recombinase